MSLCVRTPKKTAAKVLFALLLGVCTTSAQAGVFDTLIKFLSPVYDRLITNPEPKNKEPLSAQPPTARPKANRQDIIKADTAPIVNVPDLGTLLQAEFDLNRGNKDQALSYYKQEAMKDNATAVFERALSLSMQYETPTVSLEFAKDWQAKNPDHIPALFYVTHLALKADNYQLAASYLRQILAYDPNTDLSQMFVGILPPSKQARRLLLQELQALDAHQNPSLAVLKAGLLVQLDEPKAAILYLNQALSYDKDNLAYLTLKADLLKNIDETALERFLSQATLASQGDTQKQLLLYHARYLIDQDNLDGAWRVLTRHAHTFDRDSEFLSLASLLALDLEKFDQARHYLNLLKQKAGYQGEAEYYLGLSYEREGDFEQALSHFAKVDDVQFVLLATKKQVAYELLFDHPEQALAALVKLQQHYEPFVSDSVMLQADILLRLKQPAKAKELLYAAYQTYPDEPDLLFAYIKLLDDTQERTKKQAAFAELLAQDEQNPAYLLSYASFLFGTDQNNQQALDISTGLSTHDDPAVAKDAVLLLTNNAQAQHLIERLKPIYDITPTLAIGTALLRAYQALGDNAKVKALLDELSLRFGSNSDSNPQPNRSL